MMRKIYAVFTLAAAFVLLASLKSKTNDAGCINLHGERKSAGPPSCYAGEPPQNNTCGIAGCHEDFALNSGTAVANLYLGDAENGYTPGQTYTITVSLAKPGLVRGGFQITALIDNDISTTPGLITLTDATRTQLINAGNPHSGPCGTLHKTWVEHTADGIDNVANDSISWQFNWQAPSTNTGSITFYMACVDADKDLDCTGDHVYTRQKSILSLVTSTQTVTDNGTIRVYPTPFTDQLQVETQINLPCTYKINDEAGKTVKTGTLVTANNTLALGALNSGIYFLIIQQAGKTCVKRILKM